MNVEVMNATARKSDKIFSILFVQRLSPIYQEVKKYIDEQRLGEITRVNYTATNWYRPQSYYDLAEWRGTYKGEGGGVLLNQAPHQLDLLQWIFGMPKKVYAKCAFGKYHDIEVEDEVHAFFEYNNNMICSFIASTGERFGKNCLEIYGDKGKIVADDNHFVFSELSKEQTGSKHNIENSNAQMVSEDLVLDQIPNYQIQLTQNFINSILNNEDIISKGTNGIHSLRITNACYLSTWQNRGIDMPFDDELFYTELKIRM